MKKYLLITAIAAVSFLCGFTFKSYQTQHTAANYKKVTGLGGIFFKCNDPIKVKEWYRDNLGLKVNEYGANFEWRLAKESSKKGFTLWGPFNSNTNYFSPSTKDFMINYRVGNLSLLVADLKKNNVTVLDSIETYEYGKFVHIMDIEGNKIELWEPNDYEYEKLCKSKDAETTY